jgi:hypothetical protein
VPRIRTVKPGLFDDSELGRLPATARWLFVGLLTQADRRGRLKDDPARLKLRLCGHDHTADVDEDIERLVSIGMVIRYEIDGERYLQIATFEKHQRPHPQEPESEIPPPGGKAVSAASDAAVYFLQQGQKVRIGFSTAMHKRTNNLLSRVAGGRLLGTIQTESAAGAKNLARQLRRRFKREHVAGESFWLTDEIRNIAEHGSVAVSIPWISHHHPNRWILDLWSLDLWVLESKAPALPRRDFDMSQMAYQLMLSSAEWQGQ